MMRSTTNIQKWQRVENKAISLRAIEELKSISPTKLVGEVEDDHDVSNFGNSVDGDAIHPRSEYKRVSKLLR